MSEVEPALVWCPFPDADVARDIAAQLLEQKLIACANIMPAIESVFEWQGEVQSGTEVAVLLKTTCDKLDVLVQCLGESHPYDTPAIVGWRCDAAHPLTLQWLGETIGG